MQDDPFAAFKPSAPETPIEKIPLEKKKRGRKAKNKPKGAMEQAQEGTRRGVREAMVVAPVNNGGVMVPIGAIAACRHLTDDEIKFTIAVAGGISELSKSAQKHVVTALAKIFS